MQYDGAIAIVGVVAATIATMERWQRRNGEERSQPSLSLECLDADALLMLIASLVTTAAAVTTTAAGVDVVVDAV